jgi:hypothetical protein
MPMRAALRIGTSGNCNGRGDALLSYSTVMMPA